ncbi:hypothetical protein, partial [Burkholderia pseudomallei]|uniref:hypothetical protein n=1 Tax=Burkholderia pseudomallei TaxID=28450 RepID=UPI001C4CD38F
AFARRPPAGAAPRGRERTCGAGDGTRAGASARAARAFGLRRSSGASGESGERIQQKRMHR